MDKNISANLHFVISTVYVTSNCMRRNTRQFRWILKCNLKFCDQYCLCYIELYEAQHPPVQMHKNIKCDLNSVISIVYVTLNWMRRNTRQFRWIKILGAILHFVISSCLCHIELYKAQHPPVQMDKNIRCDLKFCDQYCSCYIELYEG